MKFSFVNKKIQFFTKLILLKNCENRGVSAVERSKIVTLHEEWYSERKTSEKLKFSKTAIHRAVIRFKKFGGLEQVW